MILMNVAVGASASEFDAPDLQRRLAAHRTTLRTLPEPLARITNRPEPLVGLVEALAWLETQGTFG